MDIRDFDALSPICVLSPKSPDPQPAKPQLAQFSELITSPQDIRNRLVGYLQLEDVARLTRVCRVLSKQRELLFGEHFAENQLSLSSLLSKAFALEVRAKIRESLPNYPRSVRFSLWQKHIEGDRAKITLPAWWDVNLFGSSQVEQKYEMTKHVTYLDFRFLDAEWNARPRELGEPTTSLPCDFLSRALSVCPNLRSLDTGRHLFAENSGMKFLDVISKCTTLERLFLRNLSLSPQFLDKLATLTELKALELDGSYRRVYGLTGLSRMINLTALYIKGQNISLSDGNMSVLTPLVNLKILGICDRSIGRSALEQISHLSGLQHLDLSNCNKIRDHEFEPVLALTELKLLGIACTRVTDVSIKRIAQIFSKLEHLHMYAIRSVTVLGLRSLQTLANLHVVNIGKCQEITDENVREFCKGRAVQVIR